MDSMNSNRLIGTKDYAQQRGYQMDDTTYDPSGQPVYGSDGSKIGSVYSALVEENSAKIRYLVVNTGGWFANKRVLVPVGMARVEDDGVYLDKLTKDQVGSMREWREGEDVSYDHERHNDAVLRGGAASGAAATAGATTDRPAEASKDRFEYRDNDEMFRTPNRLQLLEERLSVDKQRERVGAVEVSKKVDTRQENVNVDLRHDEVVIERHPVTEMRPAEGARLGADAGEIRVDLEAERADVRKQAFVAEEVEVSKREVAETQSFTETVGRERLEVERTGDVRVRGDEAGTNPKKNSRDTER